MRVLRKYETTQQRNRKENMKQGNNAKKTQRGKLTDERKIYAINN